MKTTLFTSTRIALRSAHIASLLCVVLGSSVPSWGQVQPVPILGGDVLGPPDFPPVLFHQFLPGPGAGFDGLQAEPNGITNFRGLAALAYTGGTAIDKAGRNYIAQTDIRVYQGEYVSADGRHSRGTFVEI
jgi:hypothetical protein